jgi:hypothetical protein
MALNSPASGEVNESTLGDCYRWAQKIGPYRSTTMMCAWSLPSPASAPKQLVMAAVATAVASAGHQAPRASSSLRSGVAWQKAIAAMLGELARLRAATRWNVGDRVNPPRARSALMTVAS